MEVMINFSRFQAAVALVFAGVAALSCGRAAARQAGNAGSAPPPPAEEVRHPAPLPAARADSAGYPFTPSEKSTVDEFLRLHADLRLATDADRQDSGDADSDVRRLYGVYHPYFVRGDLNDDGVLDFVAAFVRRDSGSDTPWFSVVVFTGKRGAEGSSFNGGFFIERDVSLARGDLSIDRDAVLITPDLSDEAVRRYRWDPLHHSYVFVRDDTDEDDSPVPTRT
jgi:hypothetical protein